MSLSAPPGTTGRHSKAWVFLALLLGACLPLLVNGLNPLMGGPDILGRLVSPITFAVLLFAAILIFAYEAFFRRLQRRPIMMIYFVLILWPFISFLNDQFILYTDINIHMRLFLYLLVTIPGFILFCLYYRRIVQVMPFYQFFVFYMAAFFFYYFFYNENAVNALSTDTVGFMDNSMASPLLFYSLTNFGVMGSACASFLVHKDPEQAFDRLNFYFLLFTAACAAISSIGYPFGLFVMVVDDFKRSAGFLTHPNPNAYHCGMILLYIISLFFYYQGKNKHRLPANFLPLCFAVCFIELILALSKGALGAFGAASSIYVLINLTNPAVRKRVFWILLSIAVTGGLALLAYQGITGDSFIELMQRRIEQTNSMDWRQKMWDYLLTCIDMSNIWFGHGLTAANGLFLQLSHRSFEHGKLIAPLMFIHNAYLQLLYDMGLVGTSFFLPFLGAIIQSTWNFFRYASPSIRALSVGMISMSIFIFIMCGIDEVVASFDALTIYYAAVGVFTAMIYREVQTYRQLKQAQPL